jgi:hypothetical protein
MLTEKREATIQNPREKCTVAHSSDITHTLLRLLRIGSDPELVIKSRLDTL